MIYGIGSLTTSLSPNLTVLLIGWSLVEGIGAALVMPAIVSLAAGTYEGPQRAMAFGVIGGVAGAAIAVGPLIGGWVTTELSWRYVFAAATAIVAVILLVRRRTWAHRLRDPHEQRVGAHRAARRVDHRRHGDHAAGILGRALPHPRRPWVPGRVQTHGRIVASGAGRTRSWTRRLLTIPPLRAGLTTLLTQQLVLLGPFFVLPVYLQTVLGLNAFETGKHLFPMSVTMFVAALAGPRLAAGLAPGRVA